MTTTVQALQRRLIALGFPLPKYGADGDFGGESIVAINLALDELETRRGGKAAAPTPTISPPLLAIVPTEWMPAAKMVRIIVHWTAGQNKASALDREHYHILIEGDGKLVRGVPSIGLNSEPSVKKGYAAHTRDCNTGSIGVSLCGMSGAIESPFSAGSSPITPAQWDALAAVLAQLCKRYTIPVTRKTVLSHAEVQLTLGIKQAGKWDISRLPFAPSTHGALTIGDQLRAKVQARL